jgi:glycosyltransferase involved in cell wall biosynthesis
VAVKKVRNRYPTVEWLVYGRSLLPPNNEIAAYRDMGYVTGEKLAEVYSMGDIMICPSWYESFPLFPLEAMACGLAVVTTPYGTEDYAENETNCLVCRPKDPDDLAKAVIRLIEDEALRKRVSLNGIETGKQFTWQRSISRLENVLEQTMSQR